MKHSFSQLLSTSIFKKQCMALSGLLLCSFLVVHLIGNCLIYLGPQIFNMYAYQLTSTPLIYIAEAILGIIFLTHLYLGIKLTIENKAARPISYYQKIPKENGSTIASSTMPYTGLIILLFIITHLLHFKFGDVYYATYDGLEVRDIHKTVVEYFQSLIPIFWYIFCIFSLGLHLSHGFWSAFQSLGFNHPKYNATVQLLSKIFALTITIGYSILPIYCYLKGGELS